MVRRPLMWVVGVIGLIVVLVDLRWRLPRRPWQALRNQGKK